MMTITSFQSPTLTDRQKYPGKEGCAHMSVVLVTSGLFFVKKSVFRLETHTDRSSRNCH